MKQKWGYCLFIALFLLACLVPSAGMFLAGEGQTGGNEVLSQLPGLRDREGKLNQSYLTDLTDYAEDNYFLRQSFVTAWSALNHRVLNTSIAGNVVLGRNGWLYFADTLDDYTGVDPMSAREIAAAARNLSLMEEYCLSQGAQFLFAVAPNKNTVYPQFMPPLPAAARSNAGALFEALDGTGTAYLRLASAFDSQEEILYFTQDSHWNSKGAALAADWINTALRRDGDRYFYGGSFTPAADHRSDLYDMLYPAGTWLETDWKYGGELDFSYDVPIRDATAMSIMTTGSGQGSLLMFRDSFGNLLYPYLADSFAQALFSRAAAYRLDLVAGREADCVVIELVERNLDYLLRYVPVMPAPVRELPEAGRVLEERAALDVTPSRDMEGYVLVSGTLPEALPEPSRVLLCAADACYEAFLTEEQGFALYVPESALTGDLSAVLVSGSGNVSIPVTL